MASYLAQATIQGAADVAAPWLVYLRDPSRLNALVQGSRNNDNIRMELPNARRCVLVHMFHAGSALAVAGIATMLFSSLFFGALLLGSGYLIQRSVEPVLIEENCNRDLCKFFGHSFIKEYPTA